LYIGGSFVTSKKHPGDIDAILIAPRKFNAASEAAMNLKRTKTLWNVHLFVIPESDRGEINLWLSFFGHDRDGQPKGLIELQIPSTQR